MNSTINITILNSIVEITEVAASAWITLNRRVVIQIEQTTVLNLSLA